MFYIFVIIILFLFILALTILQGLLKGAPYLPTGKKAIRRMLEMAEVKPGDVVYDLGSGDGRVLIIAAQEFEARAQGVEITWFYYLWSKFKILLKGLSKQVKVVRSNIFDVDLSRADVVIMFLLQDTNQKIKNKLEKELKPGARVASHYFSFAGWELKNSDKENNIYLYQRQWSKKQIK